MQFYGLPIATSNFIKSMLEIREGIKYTIKTPLMELTLSRWGDLATKKFQPECINEESSTDRPS